MLYALPAFFIVFVEHVMLVAYHFQLMP